MSECDIIRSTNMLAVDGNGLLTFDYGSGTVVSLVAVILFEDSNGYREQAPVPNTGEFDAVVPSSHSMCLISPVHLIGVLIRLLRIIIATSSVACCYLFDCT